MITVLCVSDDDRDLNVIDGCVPGGRAFQNARTLAADNKKHSNHGTNGSGLAVLLPKLLLCSQIATGTSASTASSPRPPTVEAANGCSASQTPSESHSTSPTAPAPDLALHWTASAAAPLCRALKALSVNDDICREVDEAGGLAAAVALLVHRRGEPQMVAATLELASMLAHRDACKDALATAGLLDIISSLTTSYSSNVVVLARAFGLLVAMTLRHPANSISACESGCPEVVLKAMKDEDLQDAVACSPELRGSMAVMQRAGCMAIRNICARCPELRPSIAALGAEQVLRTAKKVWPSTCGDVGAAALRDMGCEHYND